MVSQNGFIPLLRVVLKPELFGVPYPFLRLLLAGVQKVGGVKWQLKCWLIGLLAWLPLVSIVFSFEPSKDREVERGGGSGN